MTAPAEPTFSGGPADVAAALREREHELMQLVNLVPSHVWRLTADGEPTFFNRRMVDFTGLDVADTNKPGMSRLSAMIEAIIHPDDGRQFGDALRGCLASGDAFVTRYRLRRADGVYRWMSSRAEPMRNHEGEPTFFNQRMIDFFGLDVGRLRPARPDQSRRRDRRSYPPR